MVLGFSRDYLFVNINYQASKTYYHRLDDYHVAEGLKFLESWSYTKLYYTKWILTITYTLLYLATTFASIHLAFRNKKYNYYTLLTYIILFVLAGAAFASGKGILSADRAYTISRQIMGWLQSPIIAMILLPAFYLSEKK
jgi:hypothetical protein